MYKYIAMVMVVALCGCSNPTHTVKILSVHPQLTAGWNTVYAHVIVEDVETKERYYMLTLWGNTGDVFIAKESQLHQ